MDPEDGDRGDEMPAQESAKREAGFMSWPLGSRVPTPKERGAIRRRSVVVCGPHAARLSRNSDQIAESARTRRSMSLSVCSGDGVIRKRSVPRGTVG